MQYALLTLVIFAFVAALHDGRMVHQLLLTLPILAALIALYEGVIILVRLGQPWLSLAAAGSVLACLPAWYWVVRPEQIRQKRLESGVCVQCGYGPRGNVTDTCPECGHHA